jgi:hypothetical protein
MDSNFEMEVALWLTSLICRRIDWNSIYQTKSLFILQNLMS